MLAHSSLYTYGEAFWMVPKAYGIIYHINAYVASLYMFIAPEVCLSFDCSLMLSDVPEHSLRILYVYTYKIKEECMG